MTWSTWLEQNPGMFQRPNPQALSKAELCTQQKALKPKSRGSTQAAMQLSIFNKSSAIPAACDRIGDKAAASIKTESPGSTPPARKLFTAKALYYNKKKN